MEPSAIHRQVRGEEVVSVQVIRETSKEGQVKRDQERRHVKMTK